MWTFDSDYKVYVEFWGGEKTLQGYRRYLQLVQIPSASAFIAPAFWRAYAASIHLAPSRCTLCVLPPSRQEAISVRWKSWSPCGSL